MLYPQWLIFCLMESQDIVMLEENQLSYIVNMNLNIDRNISNYAELLIYYKKSGKIDIHFRRLYSD